MQSAKEEVQMYTSITRDAIGGKAFHSDATAYPCKAETTLKRYSPGCAKATDSGYNSNATNKSNTSLGQSNSCFRCGGSHPWMRNKIILCPHKDHVIICGIAAKNYKEWLVKYKAHRKKMQRH
jgi:hypothetical protein